MPPGSFPSDTGAPPPERRAGSRADTWLREHRSRSPPSLLRKIRNKVSRVDAIAPGAQFFVMRWVALAALLALGGCIPSGGAKGPSKPAVARVGERETLQCQA